MPGGHSKNTQLLGFWADDELVNRIDSVRDGARSQFMREAAVGYLVAKGVNVPDHLRRAPAGTRRRTLRGGPMSATRLFTCDSERLDFLQALRAAPVVVTLWEENFIRRQVQFQTGAILFSDRERAIVDGLFQTYSDAVYQKP